MIVLSAPSAGWSIGLDQARVRYEQTDVYVSITRPDPAAMHAQTITSLHLDSSVEKSRAIRIFARTLDYRGKRGTVPYRPFEAVGAP